MAARLFISYSHKDEAYRDQLEAQLAILKRAGFIEVWHDRRLVAGQEFDHSIKRELETADIVLLLVSPDFLKSDYIWDVEISRAMERHETGEVRVIPVILRPCAWDHAPFAKLQGLPRDVKAVTKWSNIDEAFLDITKGIERAARELGQVSRPSSHGGSTQQGIVSFGCEIPPSGSLCLAKRFTDEDKRRFLDQTFSYIVKYFEGSLTELLLRDPGDITANLGVSTTQTLTTVIYRGGQKESSCTVAVRGGEWDDGSISYFSTDDASPNIYNELLRVESDDHSLFLRPLVGRTRKAIKEKLSMEGAAKLLWNRLIEPLQRRPH